MLGMKRHTRSSASTRKRLEPKPVLENLETKQLLSAFAYEHFDGFAKPGDVAHPAIAFSPRSQINVNGLDNDGKVLKGIDREGDQWCLTLKGPGSLIVTDVVPNDGTFNDSLDTIQIVGADPKKTRVVGQTTASALNRTNGTVDFNRLISLKGVKSIELNGFNLVRDRTPGDVLNVDPEIFLPGGVGKLSFHDIIANIDTANVGNFAPLAKPFQIVIGDPTTPLTAFKPTIKVDHIFNTVFDSTYNATRVLANRRNDPDQVSNQTLVIQTPPSGPLTTPTVEFVINGTLRELDALSITNNNQIAGLQVQFPIVGSTGRTQIRANAVDSIKVYGNAKNLVASRSKTPFENGFSGLDRLGKVKVGGNADGLGLDVNGPIGKLRFSKGLGSPIDNRLNSPISTERTAANLGIADADRGYPAAIDAIDPNIPFIKDPDTGGYGALITATSIDSITVGPAETNNLLGQNPLEYQKFATGRLTYALKPGNALTSVAVAAAGSIGDVKIIGDSANSEILAGFDYGSFVNGLDPERGPSSIKDVKQNGDQVDSVIAATYGPGPDKIFGTPDDKVGPGQIKGVLKGRAVTFGPRGGSGINTILGRRGAGVFAADRTASPKLEPAVKPSREHGVLVR